MPSPQRLVARARKLVNSGRQRDARRLLVEALEGSPEPDTESLALLVLAFVEAELGDRPKANELLRAAAKIDGLSTRASALVVGQEAVIRYRAGELGAPLDLFADSIARLPADSPERATYLLDSGVIRLQRSEYASAASNFSLAVKGFRLAGDPVAEAQATHNLGYALMCQGHLAQALAHIDSAGLVLDALSPTILAVNLQDRAEVLMRAGRTREAISMIDEASRILGRRGLVQMQGECELLAARADLPVDLVRARRRARSAARRFRAHKSLTWELRANYVAAVAEGRLKPTNRWLKHADALAEQLRNNHLPQEAQLLDLEAALVTTRLGELDHSRRLLARGRTRPTDSLTERLLERQVKAELALATGRRKNALHHLRVGLDLLQDWQSSFGSLDLMSSVAGHGRELARLGIEVALGYEDPELAFEWSERARSLATRVVPVRPPADPQAAADLVEIRQITVEEPRPGTREARRLAELRERVSQRAWRGRGSGEVRDVASLAEVRLALGSDTALMSYLWDGRDIVALTVTDENAQVESLCADWLYQDLAKGLQADLDMSAASLSPAMTEVVRRSARDRLDQIADLLIAPLIDRIGDRRVVITQAGIVSGVPWGSLRGLVGRPLTVAATATSWLATRGDLRGGSAGFVAGPRVPRAEEEVAKSASAWPRSAVLTGGDATVESVVELAGSVDLLHISAHGRHSADNPLFSGVELADGSMYGYDIDRLSAVPTVVILSACEVGRSTQRWAEESLGMVNAWLHAGARCVIASPAAVADDFACELLQDVHRAMSSGAAPAEALATATADEPSTFMCFGVGW